MKFEIIEKMIPTKFVVLNGVEFELSNLFCCLHQILNQTKIDDKYGDYSLRDYELEYYLETQKLVEFGWVKHYRGSRMANLFCVKSEETYQIMADLLRQLYEID